MLSRKNRGKLLRQLRDYGIYGYVLLFVISFVVDHLVNSLRQSVQFFIISDKPKSVIRISLFRTAKRNPLIFPI